MSSNFFDFDIKTGIRGSRGENKGNPNVNGSANLNQDQEAVDSIGDKGNLFEMKPKEYEFYLSPVSGSGSGSGGDDIQMQPLAVDIMKPLSIDIGDGEEVVAQGSKCGGGTFDSNVENGANASKQSTTEISIDDLISESMKASPESPIPDLIDDPKIGGCGSMMNNEKAATEKGSIDDFSDSDSDTTLVAAPKWAIPCGPDCYKQKFTTKWKTNTSNSGSSSGIIKPKIWSKCNNRLQNNSGFIRDKEGSWSFEELKLYGKYVRIHKYNYCEIAKGIPTKTCNEAYELSKMEAYGFRKNINNKVNIYKVYE